MNVYQTSSSISRTTFLFLNSQFFDPADHLFPVSVTCYALVPVKVLTINITQIWHTEYKPFSLAVGSSTIKPRSVVASLMWPLVSKTPLPASFSSLLSAYANLPDLPLRLYNA